jgi:hypothetical protein
MRPSFTHVAAIFVTLLMAGQASATTYSPFTVSGTFTDQFKDTFALTGSIDVNTTSGSVADASFQLAGESGSNIISQGFAGTSYDLSIQTGVLNTGCNGPGCQDTLNLVLSVGPLVLLADHGGSFLGGFADLTDAGFAITLANGTISATPLPAALPLFATGLGALGLFRWRRKHKAAAASNRVTA